MLLMCYVIYFSRNTDKQQGLKKTEEAQNSNMFLKRMQTLETSLEWFLGYFLCFKRNFCDAHGCTINEKQT